MIWHGARADDPYADWWLVKIHDALVASVSMSLENAYAGGYSPPATGSMVLSFTRQAMAAVLLLPIALIGDNALPLFEPWGTVQYATTGNGLVSGIAFTLLLYVIRNAGPVFASQAAYVITLAGVGWGMILFGETHSIYIWIALLLTLAGITLVKPQNPINKLALAIKTSHG